MQSKSYKENKDVKSTEVDSKPSIKTASNEIKNESHSISTNRAIYQRLEIDSESIYFQLNKTPKTLASSKSENKKIKNIWQPNLGIIAEAKPKALIISSNKGYYDSVAHELEKCNIISITDKNNLTTEELKKLYEEYKPDIIIIDGKAVSQNISICKELNQALSKENSSNFPYLYLDIGQSKDMLIEYLKKQNACAAVCFTEKGKPKTFDGMLSPSGDMELKSNHNANIASVGKLFTILASYIALKGKTNQFVDVHPDIKLPKYIRDILDKGVTAEQLIFHQAGLGNYLMNIIQLLEMNIPMPKISDKTSLSELAPLLLENKLNMDLKQQIYSNTGYFVLGLVIETAINKGKKPSDPSWKSFYQFVKEEILADRMPNTSHIPTKKTVANKELDEKMKSQQLPATSAGCWYSTADDLYQMMEWVKQKCIADPNFKKFIIKYNSEHPLHEDKSGDVFMHEGQLPGVDAFASLNLKTSDIFCFVSNCVDWPSSGLYHLVTHKKLSDIILDSAENIEKIEQNASALQSANVAPKP